MTVRRGIAGMAFAAALSACVLAVDFAPAGGAHCRFGGIDSECGGCVRDRCGSAIDACCFDDACGGVITDVEACAAKSSASCTHVADGSDRGGLHADLSTCFARECASLCAADADGTPPAPPHNLTHCGPSYVTSVETCECETGQAAPNDTDCTEIGHPGLRCCAPDGWPGPVRSCECKKIICFSVEQGCECQLAAMDSENRATDCTGAICCKDPLLNDCTCGTTPCSPKEVKVASCTIAELGCAEGLHHVDTCTVPKP